MAVAAILVLTMAHGGVVPRAQSQGLVSIDSLRTHIRTLESAGGHRSRVTFTAGKDSAAQYIRRAFDAMPGLTSVAFDSFTVAASVPFNTKPLMNVVATLEAVQSTAPVLVLGAHYDASASRMGTTVWNQQWQTIAVPGADDNATGVAAILELARVLSDPASGFSRNVTVRFVAFASEESGPAKTSSHEGSRHFAAGAKARGESIIGMLSIDMIGFNRSTFYTAIVSDSNSAWLGTAYRRALDSAGIALQTNSRPYPTATYSDHETFWAQGYPAILLIEHAPPWNSSSVYSANPYYHTSWDTLGTVNLELVRRVTEGVMALARALNGGMTGVADGPLNIPVALELDQNYPNPFNSSTAITFRLPQADHVRLSAYDLLGREVAVLVNADLPAGQHRTVFESNLASGNYVYRLQAGSLSISKRMTLLR